NLSGPPADPASPQAQTAAGIPSKATPTESVEAPAKSVEPAKAAESAGGDSRAGRMSTSAELRGALWERLTSRGGPSPAGPAPGEPWPAEPSPAEPPAVQPPAVQPKRAEPAASSEVSATVGEWSAKATVIAPSTTVVRDMPADTAARPTNGVGEPSGDGRG